MQKSGAQPSKENPGLTRARGRPREFDRHLALTRATREFWMKGYSATSISELTEAMGISATSLYAAFGSKEALYAECLQHYAETYKSLVWDSFAAGVTARESIESLLLDSAAALTGCMVDIPHGCMVALSAVGSEGHPELGELARAARHVTLQRVKERLERAVAEGEISADADLLGLARYVQTVGYGMSVLARDGVSRDELERVARMSMLGWDDQIRPVTES